MRIESSVTSVSWIPSEAVEGLFKLPFEMGIGHYDDPLPDELTDLEALRRADAFRFANELRAFIEVEDGRITNFGHLGGGRLGATTLKFGPQAIVFQATAFPELRPPCAITKHSVTFVQTAGGRPGMPLPRTVASKPYLQLKGPTVWTTLSLTIFTDGSSQFALTGASPFPRHWVYDQHGRVAAKSGTIDFDRWYHESFGTHTPWGTEESPAFVTLAETALERQLSRAIMRSGRKRSILRYSPGHNVLIQGAVGSDLFLLLDGVLAVEVDGNVVAEVGPGAIFGERALVEGGLRTATVRALTRAKVAVAPHHDIDRDVLVSLAREHCREEPLPRGGPTDRES